MRSSFLQDMRTNISGTVPHGCSITDIDMNGRQECCAVFEVPKKPWTIEWKTAAYPEAFTVRGQNT
jgi:hypothetical protein